MAIYATTALKLNDTYVNTLPYNVCDTSASVQIKAVVAGDFALETGATVIVKFTYTNTHNTPMLNVSNTGAKPIYYKGTQIKGDFLEANDIYTFVYTGSYWEPILGTAVQINTWEDGD
jgi:hypothetical protein